MNSYGNRVRAAHRREAAAGPSVDIVARAHFVRKITQHRRMWSAAAAGARAAYWCGGACTSHRVSLSRTLMKSLFSHDIHAILSSARSAVYLYYICIGSLAGQQFPRASPSYSCRRGRTGVQLGASIVIRHRVGAVRSVTVL